MQRPSLLLTPALFTTALFTTALLTTALLAVQIPQACAEEKPVESGLSESVPQPRVSNTRQLLNKQAEQSRAQSSEGELSTRLYVQTQRRLAESFRQPIPGTLRQSTREK